ADEAGGLSGGPLTEVSTEVIRVLAGELKGRLPIIGAGGILQGADAAAKIAAGASLVQVYSGFIYRGPELIREGVDAMAALPSAEEGGRRGKIGGMNEMAPGDVPGAWASRARRCE